MKCIKCQTDNKLKDRKASGGKCTKCGHRFVFDPKANANFTDGFFANVISRVSAGNTLFFTPKQFFYAFEDRRLARSKSLMAGGCVSIVAAIIIVIIFFGTKSFLLLPVFFILLGVGVALLSERVQKFLLKSRPKHVKDSQDQFRGWLRMWEKTNGPIKRLLPAPSDFREPAGSDEVKDYSFDRAVVCEHATVAQFLIANNFHFEHNCAVLSLDHYPRNIFDTVMKMLRKNPALKVYALHNASPAGVQMVQKLLNDPKWFKGWEGLQVYDLGLLPRQVMSRRMFVERTAGSADFAAREIVPVVRSALLPEEMRWLEEGNHIDLESLRPQALLRMVTQGIALSRDPRAQGALAPIDQGDYYGGTFIYVSDSFG